MSKVSNILRMILILQNKKTVKIKDLSLELEVTPRQIRRYKDDLEQIGIYIESETGKHGGYTLSMDAIPFNIFDELSISLFSTMFKDASINDLKMILNDMRILKLESNDVDFFRDITRFHDIKHYITILKSINNKNVIAMKYIIKNQMSIDKQICPYFFFKKYDIYYLAGTDCIDQKFKYFRLSKIDDIKILEEIFEKDQKLEETEKEKVFYNSGVFIRNDLIEVHLLIENDLKEVLFEIFEGKIMCHEHNENKLHCILSIGNFVEIRHKILGFGSKIEVIYPESYRKDVLNEVKAMRKIYERGTQ